MTELSDNVRLRAALTYARRGWHVFPVHTPVEGGCSCRHAECKDVGKHPRTMHGLKDATTDSATIERWWQGWPEANVGIACGQSGLAVLDIDPRHGGDESLRDLRDKHGEDWLDTVIALTGGGGTHYLYRGAVRNAVEVLPGIDIRGEGGYIVAPPSMHQSGHEYTWERTANEVALLEWPAHVIQATRQRGQATTIGDMIPSGARNETLTSLAGMMRRRGMGYEEILASLRVTNQSRCHPPLPDTEVQNIVRSVCRYEPSNDILLRVKSGIPTYSMLRKHATEPPMYVLRINETDVRLSATELAGHRAVKVAAIAQADIVLPSMKAHEWDSQLATLMEEMEIVEVPDDASEGGLIWSAISEYLALADDSEEAIDRGMPVKDGDTIYFQATTLRQRLRDQGFLVKAPELFEICKRRGATDSRKHLNKKLRRLWQISETAMGEVS